MSRLLNNSAVLLCVIFLVSCGFIDLRQIKINIEPDKTDFVLPDEFAPVIIKFDAEMIKKDTENIFQISSDLGAAAGDKIWKGNDLYFIPVSGWIAGIRYTLSLNGTIKAADGREARVELFNTFYALNKNSPPVMERYTPSSGASVGINGVVLEFEFSKPMDRLSVESAFSLDGVSNKIYDWSDDNKNLQITFGKALSPWVLYQWNIRNSAKSSDGVPLPAAYAGFFTTDLDKTLPAVTRVFPVLSADGLWYPTGLDIETGLGYGHGIAVEFNKKMGENVLRSLRFEPSLSGRAEFLSDNSIVYIFSKTPEPEVKYILIISGDAKDNEGLKLGEDYKTIFTPDIPNLKILSLKIDDNVFYIDNFGGGALKIPVDPGTGHFNLSIHFSFMFDFNEKQNAPQRISIAAFFPRTLTPAALQYVNWVSDDRLFMRWEGLTPAKEEPHYYKLTIPGGKSGINSSDGIFMKEDAVFYLEAVK